MIEYAFYCQDADLCRMIVKGYKTIETRTKDMLKALVGKRVAVVYSGTHKGKRCLICLGAVTIGEPIRYDTIDAFRADYSRHLILPGSSYDITNSPTGYKVGYPLRDPEEFTMTLYKRTGNRSYFQIDRDCAENEYRYLIRQAGDLHPMVQPMAIRAIRRIRDNFDFD